MSMDEGNLGSIAVTLARRAGKTRAMLADMRAYEAILSWKRRQTGLVKRHSARRSGAPIRRGSARDARRGRVLHTPAGGAR